MQSLMDFRQRSAGDIEQLLVRIAVDPSQAPLLRDELTALWLASDHARELCLAQTDLLRDLVETGDLLRDCGDFGAALPSFLARCEPALAAAVHAGELGALQRLLRRFREREWLRLVWREVSGRTDVMQTCREHSLLADACLQFVLPRLQRVLVAQLGAPLGSDGQEQQLIVLALGKYGAFELNLSSDIDLILAFPEDGETAAPAAGQDAHTIQHFFTRLGQSLLAVLDSKTPDGFVFRVDLRLRPYGSAGALALSVAAMEEYYHSQGRDWERFAMIKARAVTGDPAVVQQLETVLRAFTFRRYLDFATVASLRDLKRQIEQQVRRKGLDANIKLGRGGIREIEFVAQVLQLIHGGRQPALQQRSLLAALDTLASLQLLPAADVATLRRHYLFLRRLENAVQALRDQQTHDYPAEPLAEARIAAVLGHGEIATLRAALDNVQSEVAAIFAEVIKPSGEAEQQTDDTRWQQLWLGTLEPEAAHALLTTHGFGAGDLLQRLEQFRSSRQLLALDRWSRERVDQFMPRLLATAARQPAPDLAFARTFLFVQAVLRRTVYLVLLLENPLALRQLLLLCAASPWVVELLSRYPALLDELLRPLQQPPPLQDLQQRLRQQLLRSPVSDLEEQLRVIQTFKQEQLLNVAAAELSGGMSLMKVSDYLTWLAETVVNEVLGLAWQQLTARHGQPVNAAGKAGDCDFIIIAYGKLGGLELNYASDLDLVFLHDGSAELDTVGSAAALNSSAFYVQLGQKILALLGTQTLMGRLYDIDLRLRPSGASGALVTTLAGFERYQQQEAWTWEHQALVRSRVVAGSPVLAARFLDVRNRVLGQPRDKAKLRHDILAMRERMLKQHGSRDPAVFDVKQDAGGLIDIEFLVQYGVLAHAAAHPELLRWSDNMRLLDTLAATGAMPLAMAQRLQTLYLRYRAELHRHALNLQDSKVPAERFHAERAEVRTLWQAWLPDAFGAGAA